MSIPIACPKASGPSRTLLPFRHLPWRSTVAGVAGAFLPGCIVAVLLSVQSGDLVPALVLTALTLALGALSARVVSRARIVLDSEGLLRWNLVERGARVPRSAVDRAVVRSVYDSRGIDAHRQLFLLDGEGRTVVRMNGRWWQDAHLTAVAHHFEVPLETVPEKLTLDELRRTDRRQLLRRERHPLLALATIVAAGVLAIVVISGLATAAV